MEQKRANISLKMRNNIMKEFNHCCAKCGSKAPQVHHIDGNRANNDPMNLIPLCPNCHLNDEHDPTKSIETERLKLFRRYKDPLVLMPQFQPLFRRIKFLYTIDINNDSTTDYLENSANELIEFISNLEMGSFYSKKLHSLTAKPSYLTAWIIGDPKSEYRNEIAQNKYDRDYREQLWGVREKVISLVIELLRFQKW